MYAVLTKSILFGWTAMSSPFATRERAERYIDYVAETHPEDERRERHVVVEICDGHLDEIYPKRDEKTSASL